MSGEVVMDVDDGRKREASEDVEDHGGKKTKKAWRVPNRSGQAPRQAPSIGQGDSGLWVTCHKNKEKRCIGEMRDLLTEYLSKPLGDAQTVPCAEGPGPGPDDSNGDEVDVENDIENDIKQEVTDIHKPAHPLPFEAVNTNVPCIIFFRLDFTIDPAALVRRMLEDAEVGKAPRRTRVTQRLIPATRIGYASMEGLEKLAKEVLAPYFHAENQQALKFAIRPSIRNHSLLKREALIKLVADVVGPNHKVDLKGYDALILVEVLRNVCSVSVVGNEYERLRRYNIEEIFDPSASGSSSSGQQQAQA